MRRAYAILLCVSVFLLTACNKSDTLPSGETGTSEPIESSAYNYANTESETESTVAESAEDDVIVLASDIIELPYLTLPSDHSWANAGLSFNTSVHLDPMTDRGLEEIIFDGLPGEFPEIPEELEVIDCRQEKNGLYITLAGYGEYFQEFYTLSESNGYTQDVVSRNEFDCYSNAETGDYFYYYVFYTEFEWSEHGRPFVVDFLMINN